VIDLTDLIEARRWPTDEAGWARLIDDHNILPAIVRRGVVFDGADPLLGRLALPTSQVVGEGRPTEPHPPVVTMRDLTCPACDRAIVVVYRPWGTEPRRAMVEEIRGGLQALGWHDRHPG
jgi:hypothetical protein